MERSKKCGFHIFVFDIVPFQPLQWAHHPVSSHQPPLIYSICIYTFHKVCYEGACDGQLYRLFDRYTYEVAPVFVLMEDEVLSKLRSLVGWAQGDGIFCPGGTMSNMYAMNLARYRAFPEVKLKGQWALPRLAVFTSQEVGENCMVEVMHYLTSHSHINLFYTNFPPEPLLCDESSGLSGHWDRERV